MRAAAHGDALIEPSITRRLVEQFAAAEAPPGVPGAMAGLTDREREVLRLVARGLSNAEIAAEMTVAATTVKTHVARILAKLGVRDRVQAVVLAYETGFVTRSR
ncbi:regulatory protein, luxR family [Klenkia soli]|uniref:Regulatory protein, luxR family n=1 Tax=Klenkia soli TaxID=1052260 RepID=A0A1H0C2F1_9ACTN|nr:regulatory protein, luxR family [Klenkia soli]